jgi:hypothetical protein
MCDVEIMQSFMLPDGKVTKLSQNVSYTDIFLEAIKFMCELVRQQDSQPWDATPRIPRYPHFTCLTS